MENVAVEQLLATTHLTSQVDIKQLLSSAEVQQVFKPLESLGTV
jgi:hypothetical protein